MIDEDLADIYGVKTKVLIQSIKRNIERFPLILCFNLLKRETKINQLKQRGRTDIIEDIESEYYADVSRVSKCFNDQGFRCDSKQMIDYVWIIRAQRGKTISTYSSSKHSASRSSLSSSDLIRGSGI
ncbi:MAG: ORF6N domain-containing protein [bacterium]